MYSSTLTERGKMDGKMSNQKLMEIPIKDIKHLNNTRLRIEKEDLSSLMADIQHRGLLQPIGVTCKKGTEDYYVNFGNRRLEACKRLGWETITCIVTFLEEIDFDKFVSNNFAENHHRKDLSFAEDLLRIKEFQKKGYSIGEIATLLTIPPTRVKNILSVAYRIPEGFEKNIGIIRNPSKKEGKITLDVANVILTSRIKSIKSEDTQKLLEFARENELGLQDVQTILSLIANGQTIEEAFVNYKEVYCARIYLFFDRTELAKYDYKNVTDLMRGFITGEHKPNKKLLVR